MSFMRMTIWRRRVEVESTIPPAKGGIAGFEGWEGHRTPFAPTVIIHSNGETDVIRRPAAPLAAVLSQKEQGGLHSDPLCVPTDSVVKGCVSAAVCPFRNHN